ncbi:monooxygenase [Micromonospora sp. NPDC050397]|uniref:monooxygenase n=1 Tax=Micromonospora sp. NPDC050397 TaxID=3364279 RepID=UPI00384EA1D1
MNPVPDLVTLHVWRTPRRALPRVLTRMAVDRRRLRATPGVRFGKLLGTGTGTTFGPGDADPTRWAALVVWSDPDRAADFDDSPVGRAWGRIALAGARLDLRPLASRGRWAGVEPFGSPTSLSRPDPTIPTRPDPTSPTGPAPTSPTGPDPSARSARVDGPVLALTRARLRPSRAATFWRGVPPVVAELDHAPGLVVRLGVGEAPLGWQGTVTVWRSSTDLLDFAYRQPEHRRAIMRTPTERWYAEELFARFEVRAVRGDRDVLDWTGHDDNSE